MTTEATTPATPEIDMNAFSEFMGLPTEPANEAAPTLEAETPAAPAAEAAPEATAANDNSEAPVDPLSPDLFTADKLKTPEDFAKAVERIQDEIKKANDLKRKSHRSHGAAEARAKKLEAREQQLADRETRAAAFERMVSASVEDLESGDAERFLTAIGKLTKSGDPAAFWRNVSISLASGEKLKPADQKKVDADPELRKEVSELRQYIEAEQDRRFAHQVETLKTQNYEFAKGNAATPLVQVWATENPEAAREGIAAVMLEEFNRTGRSINKQSACEIIEETLRSHIELSQRASGKTDSEKGTTSSGLDGGRDPAKALPKPETAHTTVPASLSATSGSSNRSMTDAELKAWQIRQLEHLGMI